MEKKKGIIRKLFSYGVSSVVWTVVMIIILFIAAKRNGGSNSQGFFELILKIWIIVCVLSWTLIAIYYTNSSKCNIQKLLESDFKSENKYVEIYKKIFCAFISENAEEISRYRSVKEEYSADTALMAGVAPIITLYLGIATNIENIYTGLYELLAKFFSITKTDMLISSKSLLAILMIIIVLGALKIITIFNNESYFIKVYEVVEKDIKEKDFQCAEEIFKGNNEILKRIKELKKQGNE